MAMLQEEKRDGIQLGKKLDKCCICERQLIQNPDLEIPYLEYEEVFKIRIGGLDQCICMKHFKDIINSNPNYTLLDTREYMAVPLSAMEEDYEKEVTEELVYEPVEEPVMEVQEEKKDTKKNSNKKNK